MERAGKFKIQGVDGFSSEIYWFPGEYSYEKACREIEIAEKKYAGDDSLRDTYYIIPVDKAHDLIQKEEEEQESYLFTACVDFDEVNKKLIKISSELQFENKKYLLSNLTKDDKGMLSLVFRLYNNPKTEIVELCMDLYVIHPKEYISVHGLLFVGDLDEHSSYLKSKECWDRIKTTALDFIESSKEP